MPDGHFYLGIYTNNFLESIKRMSVKTKKKSKYTFFLCLNFLFCNIYRLKKSRVYSTKFL